jgi:hypothetical protein
MHSGRTWITLPYFTTSPCTFLFSVSFCFCSIWAACYTTQGSKRGSEAAPRGRRPPHPRDVQAHTHPNAPCMRPLSQPKPSRAGLVSLPTLFSTGPFWTTALGQFPNWLPPPLLHPALVASRIWFASCEGTSLSLSVSLDQKLPRERCFLLHQTRTLRAQGLLCPFLPLHTVTRAL